MRPISNPSVQPRDGAVMMHLPPAPERLQQSLDAWVDDPHAAPDERLSRVRLRVVVLRWQAENQGRAPQDTQPLDLKRLALRELPDAIGLLENLRALDLSENALERFPPAIGEWRNLEVLVADHNRLSDLPPEMGQLRNLRYVSLSSNRLRALPDEIGDMQNLTELIIHTNELQALPDSMGRLANLRLLAANRNRLTQVPAAIGALNIGQGLDLGENPGLTHLPESIIELARRCPVLADGCGLPQHVTDALDAARVQRRAQAAPAAAMPLAHGGQLRAAPYLLSELEREALSTDDQGEPIEHADSFMEWLDRMQGTRDHENPQTRRDLESSLLQLIKEMRTDVNLCGTCFAIAAEALTSCGDRLAVGLNDMHEAAMIARVLRPGIDERTLTDLGTEMFVLQLVNTEARRKIAQLEAAANAHDDEWHEDIETMLFFQTRLRDALAPAGIRVPVATQAMLYPRCAGVSDQDISAAANRIRAVYQEGRALADFLSEWPPLNRYIELTCADELAEIELEFHNDLGVAATLGDANFNTIGKLLAHEMPDVKAEKRRELLADLLDRSLGRAAPTERNMAQWRSAVEVWLGEGRPVAHAEALGHVRTAMNALRRHPAGPLAERELFTAQSLVAWHPDDVHNFYLLLADGGTDEQLLQCLDQIEGRLVRRVFSDRVGLPVPRPAEQTAMVTFVGDGPQAFCSMSNRETGATMSSELPLRAAPPSA